MQVGSTNQNQLLWLLKSQSIAQMGSQVQAGNITAAQQTLSAVQQAEQSLGLVGNQGQTSSTLGVKVNTDFSTFMSAIQSGDLQSAQTAWSQVQANASGSSTQQGGADGNQSNFGADLTNLITAITNGDSNGMQTAATSFAKDLANLEGATSTSTNGQTTGQSSSNPLLNDMNALVSAAQSGNASTAQAALAKLQQDVQSLGSTAGVSGHHHHHHHHHAESADNTNPSTSTASTILSGTSELAQTTLGVTNSTATTSST